jgi:hypothetical protein
MIRGPGANAGPSGPAGGGCVGFRCNLTDAGEPSAVPHPAGELPSDFDPVSHSGPGVWRAWGRAAPAGLRRPPPAAYAGGGRGWRGPAGGGRRRRCQACRGWAAAAGPANPAPDQSPPVADPASPRAGTELQRQAVGLQLGHLPRTLQPEVAGARRMVARGRKGPRPVGRLGWGLGPAAGAAVGRRLRLSLASALSGLVAPAVAPADAAPAWHALPRSV